MRVSFFWKGRPSEPVQKRIPRIRRALRLALSARPPSGKRPSGKRRIPRRGALNVIFAPDREVRALNRKFLGHDYSTDVIAFPPAKPGVKGKRPPGEAPPLGEIFISLGKARRQAREAGWPFYREVAFLAVHGVLHLRGWRDHTPGRRVRMLAQQAKLLRKVGL